MGLLTSAGICTYVFAFPQNHYLHVVEGWVCLRGFCSDGAADMRVRFCLLTCATCEL